VRDDDSELFVSGPVLAMALGISRASGYRLLAELKPVRCGLRTWRVPLSRVRRALGEEAARAVVVADSELARARREARTAREMAAAVAARLRQRRSMR
jgi:hypothetical protein